jgi:hypothetical protein
MVWGRHYRTLVYEAKPQPTEVIGVNKFVQQGTILCGPVPGCLTVI